MLRFRPPERSVFGLFWSSPQPTSVQPSRAHLDLAQPRPQPGPGPTQPSPQPSPAQPSPAHTHLSRAAPALAWALPKLGQQLCLIRFSRFVRFRFMACFCLLDSDVAFSAPSRHRFWSVFGSFGAAVPLRFAVLKPRLWGLVFGAQPKAQPRPAQSSPSLSVGLAKALPKAFAYWIQMWRFRPPGGIGFGPFLARLGPPCRCVWLFWRVHVWCVLGAPKCRPAEPSTPGYATAQPSPSSA